MRGFIGLMLLIMAVSSVAVAQEGRSFTGTTKVETIIGHLGIFDAIRGIYSKWEITTDTLDVVTLSTPGGLRFTADSGAVIRFDVLTVDSTLNAEYLRTDSVTTGGLTVSGVADFSLAAIESLTLDSTLTANTVDVTDLTASGVVDLGGASDTLVWICLTPADTVRIVAVDGVLTLIDLP